MEQVMDSGVKQKKRKLFRSRDDKMMFAMLAPAVIAVFVISIVPLVYTFYLSFHNYILTKPQEISFFGFGNFIRVFSDSAILESIRNTLIFTVCSVSISLVVGVALASLINNVTRGKTFFRIVIFTPMMFSAVVVGVIWRFLFNNEMGILNYLVQCLGFSRINWLGDAKMAMVSAIIADVWQWSSYTFILALAAMEAMDPEPIEAATVDGASAVQIFFRIKFHALLPVLEVAAMFRFIWAFRSFDLIYALTNGGPGTATETMALEVWRQAFTRYDVGVSSAISVLMFLILTVLSIAILKNSMKSD
ncbi:MAG: sugar ABC transporter permease [Eubacteriales bacterium]|nr:sugar ABC transporter permease [Eubacteriales bacterium]